MTTAPATHALRAVPLDGAAARALPLVAPRALAADLLAKDTVAAPVLRAAHLPRVAALLFCLVSTTACYHHAVAPETSPTGPLAGRAPLAFDSNPLFMQINERVLATYRGAVVGNIVFVVAFTAEGAEAMRLAYLFLHQSRVFRTVFERAFGDVSETTRRYGCPSRV